MSRRRRILTDPFPWPFDTECHSDYLQRAVASREAKQAYDTPVKRTVAAERTWLQAKAQSMVSITTATDQFLLFGRLDD